MPLRVSVLLLLAGLLAAQQRFDVVVYGATAGGAVAAIAAAKEGVKVALVEPGRHVGGMVSGGLGRTDMDRQQHVIGGYSREFFERAGKAYGLPVAWTFEPKVAERTFVEWLREANVPVYFGHRLASVRKTRNRVDAASMENGVEFSAQVFIDASYEGDLMKAAGVSYAIGRETRTKYGESWAGRREFLPGGHQLQVPVSPYDERGKLLPHIQPYDSIGQLGEGDGKIQPYCFRICLTRIKENQLPIPPPNNYNPERYLLVKRYMAALGDRAALAHFLGISEMPNGKTDINAGGGVSTNLPGASWDYPEADYRRRAEIWDEHLTWAQGLLYFLGHDPSVPAKVRAEMNRWGLAKDEFPDTGHWPHQLYVRETRRMLGEYVLTQHDLETNRRKYDSIGMGGYNIDIREIQWVAVPVPRFPDIGDEVLQEGYLSVPVEPYEIPYRSLLPRFNECSNLLVTSCISASHVAYASFRMEPQYMIAGHSAGVAAAMAIKSGRALHHIDVEAFGQRLAGQKQILSLEKGNP